MTQTTSTATLFSYQFKDPGIYVFSLSTDANKKMVNFFLVSGIYKEIFSNNIIMHYFLVSQQILYDSIDCFTRIKILLQEICELLKLI